jgi:hypothetical protein
VQNNFELTDESERLRKSGQRERERERERESAESTKLFTHCTREAYSSFSLPLSVYELILLDFYDITYSCACA